MRTAETIALTSLNLRVHCNISRFFKRVKKYTYSSSNTTPYERSKLSIQKVVLYCWSLFSTRIILFNFSYLFGFKHTNYSYKHNMPRSMNMNKIRFDSFVKQYKVKYELLKTQTLKQSKTIKEDIVLLPFDLEHKTIHHALCNGFLAVFSLCLYAILQHVFKISAISTHVVFECNMPMVNGQRQQHVRLFNAAVPTFSLRGRCHKISQSCNMMSTALRQ